MTTDKDDKVRRCACNTLDRHAREPVIPIIFDERMNEYRIVYKTHDGEGQIALFYCFSCGGLLPDSRRDSFFAHVTSTETRRLQDLFQNLTTIGEVISRLGPPDADFPAGTTTHAPATDTQPERIEMYRTLIYSSLSETAEVHVRERLSGRFSLTFIGKSIGDPPDA